MAINILTPEQYYADTEYLSNSALSHFVKFDFYWTPRYNIHEFLNPPKLSSDAVLIGSLVDRILTEWFNIDDEYWPQLDKAWMQEQLELMGIEFKKADTNPVLRDLLAKNGFVFKKELPNAVRESIETIVQTAHKFRYDMTTSLLEFIAESDAQCIITNDDWGMRGKFDFINHKREIIADLKTTGNIDILERELIYKWQPNIYHKYVRQLAIYQELYRRETGKTYQVELIVIDYKGHHRVIRIGHKAIDKALEQVYKDIEVLGTMYSGEKNFIETYDISDEQPLINPVAVAEELWVEQDFLTDFE